MVACVETGLPVHQHQGTGAPDVGPDPIANTIFFTELDLWTKRTLHHLVVGGVFERHPELQVVWTEMWGLRWVVEELAQMTLRLRNVQSRYAGGPRALNYSHTFGSPVVDGLSLTPLEYFRRNCSIGAGLPTARREVLRARLIGSCGYGCAASRARRRIPPRRRATLLTAPEAGSERCWARTPRRHG